MNDKLVDVTILLDRSGSMMALRAETVSSINAYIEDRKGDPASVSISLTQFDTLYEPNFVAQPASMVPAWSYEPRGYTALLDAMGKAIKDAGARLAAMPEAERPSKVIFVCVTDGYENSSREFSQDSVKALIDEHRRVWKWEFVFLGAGIDAFDMGTAIGVSSGSTYSVGATGQSVQHAFRATSANTRSYVTGRAETMDFTPSQDEEADKLSGAVISNRLKKAKK